MHILNQWDLNSKHTRLKLDNSYIEIGKGTHEWYVYVAENNEKQRIPQDLKPHMCSCGERIMITMENVLYCKNGCLWNE